MYFGQNTFIFFRNTFSDITAAIYEIEEILNYPGLCIFCEEHNGGIYFALSLKMRMLESILSEI